MEAEGVELACSCAARRDIETIATGWPGGTESAVSLTVAPLGCRAGNVVTASSRRPCGYSP